VSLSDFPDNIARVRAGECPLCGGELDLPPYGANDCPECDVGWGIYSVHDPLPEHGQAFGMGPMLVSSRKLTDDEARRLFSRPVGEG